MEHVVAGNRVMNKPLTLLGMPWARRHLVNVVSHFSTNLVDHFSTLGPPFSGLWDTVGAKNDEEGPPPPPPS